MRHEFYVVPFVLGQDAQHPTFGTNGGALYECYPTRSTVGDDVRHWARQLGVYEVNRVFPSTTLTVGGCDLKVVHVRLDTPNLSDCLWFGPRPDITNGGRRHPSEWRGMDPHVHDVLKASELWMFRHGVLVLS